MPDIIPIDQSILECINALDGLQNLPEKSVDVIICSPPYNCGKDYDGNTDNLPRDEYLRFIGKVADEMARVLKDQGSVFFNFSGRPIDRWLPHEVILYFRKSFELQNEIHWIKSISVDDVTYGQFQPINSHRFLNCQQEYLWHFTKNGDVSLNRLAIGVPHKDPSNLKRWKAAHQNGKHCRGNVWHVPYETRQGKAIHPAMFPVKLPQMCLDLHGLPPRTIRDQVIVCDPFCGVGTTGIAAVGRGCKFVGFDLSMTYLAIAASRIHDLTGIKSLLKITFQATEE